MGKKGKHSRLKKWGFAILESLEGIAIIISIVIDKVPDYSEYKVSLSYINENEEGLIYENEKELPDAWLCIQGQIVVKSKDDVMIKTFIIDNMYEDAVRIADKKKFVIKNIDCPLADVWMEKLYFNLESNLLAKGYQKDEIVIEKIGLVCICIQSKNQKKWLPFYYILEGNSLTRIDENTAEAKMHGVMVTEELLDSQYEIETKKIMDETVESVLKELE